MAPEAKVVKTQPYEGQKPGTSGLRKKVKVFQQPNYTENFIEAILQSVEPSAKGATLVIAGDGRFYNAECIQLIIKMAAAHGVSKLIIGENGYMSTPAASHMIRLRKATGGILLTASHNPGGPNSDLGIKYNGSSGAPAPEAVTDKIFSLTKTLSEYRVTDLAEVDISKVGTQTAGPVEIEVVSTTADYVEMLKGIFDFDGIRSYLKSSGATILFDGMSAVTGPYAKAIFVNELGLDASKSLMNCDPSPTFKDGHPDPNLTYAHELVERVEKEGIDFGAASDGDGDRNMIYGKGAFVTPSDSVAIIAHWAQEAIPYFKSGIKGLARSMPTSAAIDRVAEAQKLDVYEVPTGWKFFGNLMDAGKLSICGEESFGTGSDHIREKDGLWAVMAWLSILAAAHKKGINGIGGVLSDFYSKYGRTFFSRYDYEEIPNGSDEMMAALEKTFAEPDFVGRKLSATSSSTSFVVKEAANFSYTDPIDHSVSKKQGLYVKMEDGSRLVFRLSGTGSSGATVRLYLEQYSRDESQYGADAQEGLKPLIEVALALSQLEKYTGRSKPTVIT